jgi:hypothetical protein
MQDDRDLGWAPELLQRLAKSEKVRFGPQEMELLSPEAATGQIGYRADADLDPPDPLPDVRRLRTQGHCGA